MPAARSVRLWMGARGIGTKSAQSRDSFAGSLLNKGFTPHPGWGSGAAEVARAPGTIFAMRRLALALLLAASLAAGSAGAAAKRPGVTEVQVNAVLGAPFPTNKQDEPSLAQNPVRPLNLVAGANDEAAEPACADAAPSTCRFVPGTGISGFYASFDGGRTWPCQGQLDLSAHGEYSFGDPGQVFDTRGSAYYATLAFPSDLEPDEPLAHADVFVAKSDDGGCHYTTAVRLDQPKPQATNDKPAIASDTGPKSPYRDNLYVVWTESRPGTADAILFSRSTDHGATWSTPFELSSETGSRRGERQGSAVKVAPDGTVLVAWLDSATPTRGQRIAISGDGGRTFSIQDAQAAPVTDDSKPLPGTSFREARAFPAAATGPRGGLYLAWGSHTNGHGDVVLTSSLDRGRHWSRPATVANVAGRTPFFVSIAVEAGGAVDVAFLAVDDRPAGTASGAGVVAYDLYVARKPALAKAFTPPLLVSQGSSDPDGSSANALDEQFIGDYITALADVKAPRLYVTWTDSRRATPCPAVDAFRAKTEAAPDVISQCPVDFGNTDIFLSTLQY